MSQRFFQARASRCGSGFLCGRRGGETTFCLAQLKHVYALHNLHDISQDWLRFVRSWVWAQFGDHQVELLP